MDLKIDFESYWVGITGGSGFEERKEAARAEWEKCPEKHVPIMRWLNKHGPYTGRNPFFFIQDFKVRRVSRQELSFDEYYKRYYTTEETDGWKRIYLKEQQKTIYVKD